MGATIAILVMILNVLLVLLVIKIVFYPVKMGVKLVELIVFVLVVKQVFS